MYLLAEPLTQRHYAAPSIEKLLKVKPPKIKTVMPKTGCVLCGVMFQSVDAFERLQTQQFKMTQKQLQTANELETLISEVDHEFRIWEKHKNVGDIGRFYNGSQINQMANDDSKPSDLFVKFKRARLDYLNSIKIDLMRQFNDL